MKGIKNYSSRLMEGIKNSRKIITASPLTIDDDVYTTARKRERERERVGDLLDLARNYTDLFGKDE